VDEKSSEPGVYGSRVPTGLSKYLQEYEANHPDINTLQGQVDKFMEAFDIRRLEERKRKNQPEVDEDGFTKVTYNKSSLIQAKRKAKQEEQIAKKKKKTKNSC